MLLAVQTASSCAAGLTSACMTNPFDVIKTRLQAGPPACLDLRDWSGSKVSKGLLAEIGRHTLVLSIGKIAHCRII